MICDRQLLRRSVASTLTPALRQLLLLLRPIMYSPWAGKKDGDDICHGPNMEYMIYNICVFDNIYIYIYIHIIILYPYTGILRVINPLIGSFDYLYISGLATSGWRNGLVVLWSRMAVENHQLIMNTVEIFIYNITIQYLDKRLIYIIS